MDDRRNLPAFQGIATVALRWSALVAMAVWFGGFTFYSAFVIPILHEAMGGLDAGDVTRQVSALLNLIGVPTLASWWLVAFVERGRTHGPAHRLGFTLLALDTAILAGLFALHPVLSARLEAGSFRHFYPLHQVYLIASTAQWGVNLGLLGVRLWLWRRQDQEGDKRL